MISSFEDVFIDKEPEYVNNVTVWGAKRCEGDCLICSDPQKLVVGPNLHKSSSYQLVFLKIGK